MCGKLLLFFIFLFIRYSAGNSNSTAKATSESNLISVIVIYRHGARTPIKPYPNDPYRDEKYWPVGFGQLTNRGKEQEYELGQWLRNRYNNFLSMQYQEKDVYVRSTDVDRTLMSAEVNLAGIYPLIKNETWNSKINWQPIPVHTLPEKDDAVLAMKKPCPKYDGLVKDLNKDPTIVDINKRNHDLYSFLSRNTGKHVKSMTDLEYIYSTLRIEADNNFTLPNWTQKVFPNKLKPLAEYAFTLPCYTREMAKLKVGPLFNEIREHVRNVTNATLSGIRHPKLFIYSAHDTTIANVLRGLDVFDVHAPPFSATIMLELYKTGANNDRFYINVFYKNSTLPQNMTLHGCDFNCPIDDFFKLTDPIAINLNDWHAACKTFSFYDAGIFVIITFAGIIAISCLLSVVCRRNGKEKTYLRLPDDETV